MIRCGPFITSFQTDRITGEKLCLGEQILVNGWWCSIVELETVHDGEKVKVTVALKSQ